MITCEVKIVPPTALASEDPTARASEVSYAVNAIGFEAPFQTDAVVTLVDAWSARRALREHEDLFMDQVRAADLVLLAHEELHEPHFPYHAAGLVRADLIDPNTLAAGHSARACCLTKQLPCKHNPALAHLAR